MNILLVCAHPDDETIGMGGTLRKLSKNNKTKVLFLTDGVMGRRKTGSVNTVKYEISKKEEEKLRKEVELRKKHAIRALRILGVRDVKFLDFPNVELDKMPLLKIIKEVEKEISLTKCDTIFTHHYNDINLDHRVAYEAALTAARPVPWSKVSTIISFEIPASTDWRRPYKFNPNLYVEITSELKYKLKALKEYHYEIRHSPHPRSQDMTEVVAKRWGSLSGYQASEAFEIVLMRVKNSKNILF